MAKSICEHIRNVKSSLENAEKSFRENNGMRGELDLMLAEAEIKHLREKRGWVSVWTRQRLALLAAAIVVLAGYGGWLYAGTVEEPGVKLQNPAAVMASTELQKICLKQRRLPIKWCRLLQINQNKNRKR